MKIWLTTDTHLDHVALIQYGRPGDFIERLKNNLVNMVGKDDLLIHLGDVCIGNDEKNNVWFKQIGAKRILVLGNHDTKSVKWYMEHGWDLAVSRFDLDMFGKRICFSHYPMAWDGYFDVNVHGHFHDTDKRRQGDFQDILSGYNKLLAIEHTNYQPVLLETFIN